MADAVRGNALAMSVLTGVCETTLRFRWNGLDCRATPDCRGRNYLTELKTTSTVDPVRFPWHAIRMQYHVQMAMQRIAAEQEQRTMIEDCYIVAAESDPPHVVQVFRIEDRALEIGQRLLMLWSERLKVAEQSRTWPGYADCVCPIDVEEEEPELIFPDEQEA